MAHMVNAVHPDAEVRPHAANCSDACQISQPGSIHGPFPVGAVLSRGDGAGQRRKGMLQLVYLITDSSEAHPYLAGMAMAIMADEFDLQGEHAAAARLRSDLERSIPGHPVLHTPLTPVGVSGSADGKEIP